MDNMSVSVFIDSNENYGLLDTVLPRRTHTWADDSSVSNCHNCNKPFTIFFRKHHCRLCGRIFCYKCSDHFNTIPKELLSNTAATHSNNNNKTDTWKNYISSYVIAQTQSHDSHRVCFVCNELINRINKIINIVQLFNIMRFDVIQLRKLRAVCKTWNYASNYCLSIFREIQYKFPINEYTQTEINMLWTNSKYFSNHNRAIIPLLKVCTNDQEVSNALKFYNLAKTTSCKTLMCSRSCSHKISSLDCINILAHCFRSKSKSKTPNLLIRMALKNITCNDKEFSNYIPFLTYNIRYDNDNLITNFLAIRCIQNFDLLNILHWESVKYTKDEIYGNVYSEFLKVIKQLLDNPNHDQKLLKFLQEEAFIQKLKNISTAIYDDTKEYSEIKDKYNLSGDLIYPLNPTIRIKQFIIDDIKIKKSCSKPMIVPCKTSNNKIIKVMFKRDNLQTDQLVMNLLNITQQIVKEEEGISLDLDTYNIISLERNEGIIEIIQDAETLYHIQEKRKTTILNYILENNVNCTVKEIRDNFIKSLALYSVMTYLLGVGDRHLENIMVSPMGKIFHVDFSFIMGKDPVFNNPSIRITSDMVDAIGGIDSAGYQQFKDLSSKIYNCVRRNMDIFVNILLMIPNITNNKITEDEIKEQIIKRFIPGENEVNAKFHLVAKLEEKSYTDRIKDFCHYHTQEKTLGTTVSNVFSSLFNKTI